MTKFCIADVYPPPQPTVIYHHLSTQDGNTSRANRQ